MIIWGIEFCKCNNIQRSKFYSMVSSLKVEKIYDKTNSLWIMNLTISTELLTGKVTNQYVHYKKSWLPFVFSGLCICFITYIQRHLPYCTNEKKDTFDIYVLWRIDVEASAIITSLLMPPRNLKYWRKSKSKFR